MRAQRVEFASFNDDKNRLKLTALKGYVDGTLGSRTAAMLAPFSDDAGIREFRAVRRKNDQDDVERDKEGWQITLHAIGDRANRMAWMDLLQFSKRWKNL
jgi:predicted amidohydrolase YtcJ